MADAWLQSLLTHIVNVYHLVQTTAGDGQIIESYPDRWSPDILNLACAIHTDGKLLQESAVGLIIGSDAIMYCEQADIREGDRIHFGARVYYVNRTPARYYEHLGSTPMTPHLLEVGLVEHKPEPA